MAAAAAAAAAALLFSPPSSVGSGISPGGPLSSLHPNSHLHHHVLSPLAPLALPPHSTAAIGLTPAHQHHHIQQQLQQYAAAAVAAATAAAVAAASSAGDSTSPPPNLPLSLPPMAHHYANQNNNVGGSNKRRSTGGTTLTVQQQLYRRSGTPTSSAASSPSPRLLNSSKYHTMFGPLKSKFEKILFINVLFHSCCSNKTIQQSGNRENVPVGWRFLHTILAIGFIFCLHFLSQHKLFEYISLCK